MPTAQPNLFYQVENHNYPPLRHTLSTLKYFCAPLWQPYKPLQLTVADYLKSFDSLNPG